jgi:protein-L-isoaspartate O-methyltransferase
MQYSATYSPEDNKLRLTASARLDEETYKRVRAAGFIWAPRQEIFVAPMWTPDRADLCTELAGDIGDEDTSLVDRAEERADRFTEYSASRQADADAAHKAVHAIADGIPLGQPILVGHHSEKHARRDAEKIENGMRRAVKMWETSTYWKQRAAGAIRAAKYKERPDVRARRIKGLESDVRVYRAKFTPDPRQPAILQHRWNDAADAPKVPHVWCSPRGGRGGNWVPADELPAREAYYSRWIAHCEMRLEYERAMLDEQGGAELLKPKPKSAAAQLPLCNYRAPEGLDIPRIPGFGRGEIVHYPQVEMTQAEYAKINTDYKGTRVVGNSHRVRTAMRQHALVSVFLTDAKTHTPPAPQEPAPPAEPKRWPAQLAPEPANSEPAPAADFAAMRESLKAGVQVVTAPQLFPTPPALADRMVAEANIQPGNRILEPSAGTGNLIAAIAAAEPTARVTAVEINTQLADALSARYRVRPAGWEILTDDFLDLTPLDLGRFDRIVMNPPFANGDDMRHIRNAFEMLSPSGRLVAICANGPRQQEQLRPFVEENGGTWEELPRDTFKESGTGVSTVLLTMNAPESDPAEPPQVEAPDDEPTQPEEVLTAEPNPEEEPMQPIHTVPASRLSWGKWDAAKQKDIGEGDIHKAYSGDTISSGKIRGVITIDGKPYTVTGFGNNDAHLWPLLTPAQWGEKPTTTYGDVTRADQFTYEGIRVKRGKDQFVMGPRSGEIRVQGDQPAEPAAHTHATREEERICEAEQEAIANDDEPEADDLCDLCMASGVHVDRTTYCGKTIGIECGCEEANTSGKCANPDCEECNAPHDDEEGEEPEAEEPPQPPASAAPEEVFTLAPTAAIPAQQMSLFASGEESTQ